METRIRFHTVKQVKVTSSGLRCSKSNGPTIEGLFFVFVFLHVTNFPTFASNRHEF